MLTLAFTYHQVMPGFLDLVYSFGRQEYAQDFHFSVFQEDTRLSESDRGLKVPELGWSGRDIRMGYGLKSVEPSTSQQDWPWSIRHCAVHHSCDVVSGRATWIVIKGNHLMKDRIESATESQNLPQISNFNTVDRAFASTLATHLIICDWAGDNWRWYINFLEEEFQSTTRGTLSAVVEQSPREATARSPMPHRRTHNIRGRKQIVIFSV